MIIGPGGAGKSWLATGLDRVTEAAWKARGAELVAGDRWVIDGNYGGTLATRTDRADTIVFLDVSRWASLAGVLARRLRGEQRDDMTEGCPESLTPEFLRWLWRYHDHHRPTVLEQIGAHAYGAR